MNIQILDSWLKEHLSTKVSAKEIAKMISLCGPSFESTTKHGKGSAKGGPASGWDWLYDIEVTTNRVDCMSVRGIAREASAILPRFGKKASLKKLNLKKPTKLTDPSVTLEIIVDHKLTGRVMGVVFEDIKNTNTPDWMKKRLTAAGIRSKDLPIDITNYVMTEIGHPTHVFDYDKIKDNGFIIREAKKGEKIVSFDNKTYKLSGGEIVIANNKGKIIDLPGIIGTKNSVVTSKTKRILFFIDNNDPVRIRKASMELGIRTVAATLNEKGVDAELAENALYRGIELFEKLAQARRVSNIIDLYPNPYKPKSVEVGLDFIIDRMGVNLTKAQITKTLKALEFEPKWIGSKLRVIVPSFRANDIDIAEDIVEEIARIYGYHNLSNTPLIGEIPTHKQNINFAFENKVKQILKATGGVEIYTLSLVSKDEVEDNALKLKNPLGSDTAYMRTSLMPSLKRALTENKAVDQPIFLFEMAHTYLSQKNNLPQEKIMLAGIHRDYKYKKVKGILEIFLDKLNINYRFNARDTKDETVSIYSGDKNYLGKIFYKNQNKIYWEFDVDALIENYSEYPTYKPIAKYPAQIEDITFVLPENTYLGEVIQEITQTHELVADTQLTDQFENAYTFRIYYEHPTKTLTDHEIEKVRKQIIEQIKRDFGASVK